MNTAPDAKEKGIYPPPAASSSASSPPKACGPTMTTAWTPSHRAFPRSHSLLLRLGEALMCPLSPLRGYRSRIWCRLQEMVPFPPCLGILPAMSYTRPAVAPSHPGGEAVCIPMFP